MSFIEYYDEGGDGGDPIVCPLSAMDGFFMFDFEKPY